MTDREKIINAIEKAKKQSEEYALDRIVVPFKEADIILALLKEQDEETRFVYDEYMAPTCEKCTFHPFAGYIPTIKWMQERGYMKCPRCGRSINW